MFARMAPRLNGRCSIPMSRMKQSFSYIYKSNVNSTTRKQAHYPSSAAPALAALASTCSPLTQLNTLSARISECMALLEEASSETEEMIRKWRLHSTGNFVFCSNFFLTLNKRLGPYFLSLLPNSFSYLRALTQSPLTDNKSSLISCVHTSCLCLFDLKLSLV